MRLNLGCGKDIRKDYINLDSLSFPGVDVVCNVENERLPFDDNFFDEVYCDNVLEHIANLEGVLREIHRVTCKNGAIRIRVPHFSSFCAYNDPTHKRFFGMFTFDYFTENKKYNYYTELRFVIVKRELSWYWFKNRKGKDFFISLFISTFPLFYERFLCWIFPAIEIYFELKPVKD